MLTSVQITDDDYKFIKEHSLKFSELMREAITNKKQLIEGLIVDNVSVERQQKEKFKEMAEKLRNFIEDKGLIDELLKQEGYT